MGDRKVTSEETEEAAEELLHHLQRAERLMNDLKMKRDIETLEQLRAKAQKKVRALWKKREARE